MNLTKGRKGFTIIEMSVATGMMALLALVLSYSWRSLGKATVDLIARVQLAQEMDFAVAALSHDLGGCVVNSVGTATFPFVKSNTLFIYPTSSTSSSTIAWRLDNDDTISYELDTSSEASSTEWKHNLIRRYTPKVGDSKIFTVAKNVDSITASWDANDNLVIKIEFSCNYKSLNSQGKQDRTRSILKRACKLVTSVPSPKET